MISQEFGGGVIVEATKAGAIVLEDDVHEEGIAFGVTEELVFALVAHGRMCAAELPSGQRMPNIF